MALKDYEEKRLDFECECGCSRLSVIRYNWDDDESSLSLSHYMLSWDANAHPVREGFRQMFKMIWCAITGKEYYFYELVLDRKRLEEFKKFVAEL